MIGSENNSGVLVFQRKCFRCRGIVHNAVWEEKFSILPLQTLNTPPFQFKFITFIPLKEIQFISMFFMQIHDLLTPTQVQKLYISFTLYVLS